MEYFEEVIQIASQSDEWCARTNHLCESRKIYPFRKVCYANDGDNTASVMMYLYEKVGASVQRRGKKNK